MYIGLLHTSTELANVHAGCHEEGHSGFFFLFFLLTMGQTTGVEFLWKTKNTLFWLWGPGSTTKWQQDLGARGACVTSNGGTRRFDDLHEDLTLPLDNLDEVRRRVRMKHLEVSKSILL